ncbi:MAG TPA: hypothetical protein VEZ51_01795 [Gemmatimonadaceae bacterium]|nr:hypothetical protein [Gemmatimonadaceae bacterium]
MIGENFLLVSDNRFLVAQNLALIAQELAEPNLIAQELSLVPDDDAIV